MSSLIPVSCKVFTPPVLAHAMVSALGDHDGCTWLEPCHGNGVFLRAMANAGVGRERITAIDLDASPAAEDKLAITRRGVDFIAWAMAAPMRFDRIVGNPPFLAIRQAAECVQERAAALLDFDGKPIGRGANLWYAFAVCCVRLLRPGGHFALVLPSGCEFTDYSSAGRAAIPGQFAGFEVYRCHRPLFDEVQEGTVVVLGRNFGAGPCVFRRRRFSSPHALIEAVAKSKGVNGRRCRVITSRCQSGRTALGNVAEIRLGGVTGDSSYFLLTEGQRRALGLPRSVVVPVLSRAKHLNSPFVTEASWEALRQRGERVWLFRPSMRSSKHPKVQAYLKAGENGACRMEAFKISNRSPWYRTPLPQSPHGFLTGMGCTGPWICMNGMRGLTATNTLYVISFRRDIGVEQQCALALSMLTSEVQKQLRRLGRRYADGLVKFEPGALARLELPVQLPGRSSKELYATAIEALLRGDRTSATRIADAAFSTRDRQVG